MTLLCADWTYRKLSGENDSWKLGLQLKPFRPFWVRPTLVGGDWEVNKQQVNQQYSPVDTVSSRPRWGERHACNSGDVTRPSHGKTSRKFMAPIIHLQILPSQGSQERRTSSLKTFSATVLSQNLTTWINHCWKDLHQPYPKMPSTTNNYQVFLCCTKNTMSVSLSSPESLPLTPPQHLSCSCLSVAVLTIFSQTHKHTDGPLSLDYLLKHTRTVTWPLGVATLSVTNLCCRVFQ